MHHNMWVRERLVVDGGMAQITQINSSATPTTPMAARSYVADSSQNAFVGAPARGGAKGKQHTPQTANATRVLTLSPLLRAIQSAAEATSASIAEATRQRPDAVRAQLQELTNWLTASLADDAPSSGPRPPILPRDYIAALRKNLLVELDAARGLAASDVVQLLIKVDEAGDGWKRTDRGKFISRLTGSDCADAVVAIAHDIRSPLCSILLLVDSLRRSERALKDPVRDRQLGLIYGAALGLSTTVSNLVDAARGSTLVHGRPTPFSITETLLAVSSIVQPMCEEKGIPLEVTFPKNDVRFGYASAIQQALLNLTSNALRYTDSGSVALGCNELAGNRAQFWVQDTGPGIPDHVVEQLCYGFPPEGAPLRFSSAGLGLAIVRTLVEAMGSTLQIDTDSRGTNFSFVLDLPQTA
jgi:signal transduction histidine kinase